MGAVAKHGADDAQGLRVQRQGAGQAKEEGPTVDLDVFGDHHHHVGTCTLVAMGRARGASKGGGRVVARTGSA